METSAKSDAAGGERTRLARRRAWETLWDILLTRPARRDEGGADGAAVLGDKPEPGATDESMNGASATLDLSALRGREKSDARATI